MSTAPCSALMLGSRVAQTLLIDCLHRFVRKVTTKSTHKPKQANAWARFSALALSLLSTCESQQIFGPARFAQKLLMYQIHKYCLFSALLTTRLSSTLCGHLFSTCCRWFGLLLKVQRSPRMTLTWSSRALPNSPSMQVLWDISWSRSVAHMRLTIFVRLGFALIM
jgi:hypothetical protein